MPLQFAQGGFAPELNNLTWTDFKLDASPPHLRVPASITKNRKEAIIPLHSELAAMLLRLRPADADPMLRPFWHRVPRIETLRKDLKEAKIPLRDEQGRRVDFHSLRMTFGTTMLANGVHPIVVKELMRHSDLKLTTNLYTDSSQLPLAKGVAALPSMAGEVELTGPHGTQKRTQKRAQTGVSTGREQSPGVISDRTIQPSQPAGNGEIGHVRSRQHATVRAG